MATKERNQNPVLGDTIKLRLMAFNSNMFADVSGIEKVDIYHTNECKPNCPPPGKLVQTVPGNQVVHDGLGKYYIEITPTGPDYTTGPYSDVWHVITRDDKVGQTTKQFNIYSDLWYFGTLPPVYSFNFNFQPNKYRQGSRKYMIINIVPNVPRATDLQQFYTNLAVVGELRISIEKACGPCPIPSEKDLRLVVDKELVEIREKVFGYYYMDTETLGLDCGLYNVWFDFDFGDVHEVSPKSQIEVY